MKSEFWVGLLCFDIFLSALFLVLKITGTVAWSWWIVLSPLVVPVAVSVALIIALAAILDFVAMIFGAVGKR